MIIRKYTEKDISEMVHIWNEVVEDGVAFPQEEFLTEDRNKVKSKKIPPLSRVLYKILSLIQFPV